MPKDILLSDIKAPDHYIRGKMNLDYVGELKQVLADAIGRGEKWPFPPVEIMALEKPEVTENILDKKGTVHYVLVDGFHRCGAAASCHVKNVPAEIKQYRSIAHAFLAQMTANDSHGLRLDKAARNNGIKVLHVNYGWPLKQIGDAAGLSEGSISRIWRDMQATGETGKRKGKGGRKKKKKQYAGVTTDATFAPLPWYQTLGNMTVTFDKHKDDILRNMVQVDPAIVASAHGMTMTLLEHMDALQKKV